LCVVIFFIPVEIRTEILQVTPEQKPVYSRYYDSESMELDQYRYTEWMDGLSNRYAQMLYDHNLDPDENVNIVEQPRYKDQIAEMTRFLEKERSRLQTKKNNDHQSQILENNDGF